ncbi:hypothetical protein HYFRA_00006394 [Hymenoscyphus fraxineus]|uniref:Spc7 kinetochore protein domain-containing protein n=1 Tax=Hymenoscyphus fraxineus TaxID=746836 RepID=A0A9N9KSY1_9HELO|nr:hypothetical protein HYFRA_00006394 [Hymenoscyphus fraxineus]
MASRNEVTLPATRPKSRKSLGSIPSAGAMDQENMTTDFAALASGKRAPTAKPLKKSRSKSIGPGGLDALKDTTGNRRKSIATVPHPAPKSILKPTMPPLREIPAHNPSRRGNPKKTTPPTQNKTENLIDFDVGPTVSGADNLANPFDVGANAAVAETRVTLRTEEEQQAAAREREEQERKALEKEIISRRDARRKSLANRRVSFAPEATLHTWDVVVEYQDSTTSSNATSRRASSASNPQTPGLPDSESSEPPSTPPEQVEEETDSSSPAHQRGLHQKKSRRSSGIPPMNFNNPEDEVFSSSPFSDNSGVEEEEPMDDMDVDSNSNSDSDIIDDTAMSMDVGDTMDMSLASSKSGSSTSSRLDEALRQAARQAGAQEQEETEEIAFAPWTRPAALENLESQGDQENVNPFTSAYKANAPQEEAEQSEGEDVSMDLTMDMTRPMGGIITAQTNESEDDELSMDVTKAFGGIITNPVSNTTTKRKAASSNRRQSTRRKSLGEDSSMGDETMDLTMAVGGIKPSMDNSSPGNDEDITMEFTSVVGGVLPPKKAPAKGRRQSMAALQKSPKKARESIDSRTGDTMDMTVAVGGIMATNTQYAEEEPDPTIGMDMTAALGGILQPPVTFENRAEAKKVMELETDIASSPFRVDVTSSPPKPAAPAHTIASETGSPSLVPFRKGARRSTDTRKSTTPKSKLSSSFTPTKPTTPPKQLTPQPVGRPTTPSKTPPSKNVAVRTSSPKKLFKNDFPQVSTTPQSFKAKKTATPNKLFQRDKTGMTTPSFILTPQRRRSSGVGLDREGLGSPRVAALLDRRISIGEQAASFSPSLPGDAVRGVHFLDPRAMQAEIDKEHQQEEDRENGRSILEREADDETDATLNLKNMIESLSPKKKSTKPRKSLHVGAAKGILGKRPVELDEDDEDEDEGGIKRLKNHQGSPVKNVRLSGPPSKEETTTGRVTRASRKSIDEAEKPVATPTTTSSPAKATTPRVQGRFKDAEAIPAEQEVGPLAEKEPIEDPQVDEETFEDDRIQLQDFLNMTSIRFMELTTSKRRHTIAPKSDRNSKGRISFGVTLEDCIAASAATVPMLELFQHACQELRKYISEGRKTVREIETATFEENPPLFREYMSATPDIKVVMDNQLKNVKTHARLLSKEMWYDWRMTLLGTLKEALFKTGEGMMQDEEILDHQLGLLNSVIPKLGQRAQALQREEADLRAAAEELANCDPVALTDARQKLIAVDLELDSKKRMISDLRKQLEGKEAEIKAGIERKQTCIDEISEAERIREECRGWTSGEITSLKAKVDAIEKELGWTITGVSGTTTSMTYQKDIELVFDAASFLPSASHTTSRRKSVNSRIDLWYIGANRDLNPQPLNPEKDFFLQSIRDHIRGLPQAQTHVKDLLHAVSVSWNRAQAVVDDIRLLGVSCPTEVEKTSDSSISVRSILLIAPLTTRVEVRIGLGSKSGEGGIEVGVEYKASVVYGERFNEPKMGEFLLSRCGSIVEEKGKSEKSSWGGAVAELGEKLLARGRKS